MNATRSQNPAAPALFASVRGSRDLSLVAFAVALLAAFALNAGAFVPRLSPSDARRDASAAGAAALVASQPVPCTAPRG